jgi:hypothetical protein
MLIAPTIARLAERVPILKGRVAGAASLAGLLARDAVPEQTPAAHVILSDIAGGNETALSGMYRQAVQRQISVMLTVRSHDASGRRALETIEDLIEEVIVAIAGWLPGDTAGPFSLRRARLVRFANGVFVYEITFALNDHLRITP